MGFSRQKNTGVGSLSLLQGNFLTQELNQALLHCVLAWRIPGIGEPGGLLSMGSYRVGPDWSDLAAATAAAPSLQVDTLPAELPGKPYGLRVIWQKCLWKNALRKMSIANMLTVKVPVTSRDVLGHRNIPSQWFSVFWFSVSLACYFLILPF